MSPGLAVVLIIVNFTGAIIIGHIIRWVWSYQSTYSRCWCKRVSTVASFALFSGAVMANTFIGAVYNAVP